MATLTGRPSTGARLSVVLSEQTETLAKYRGFVHLPDADVPIDVSIDVPGGAVRATLGEGGTPDLTKAATLLVRAATKAELAARAPLPRRITRWRG
jgi:hypothetical protein